MSHFEGPLRGGATRPGFSSAPCPCVPAAGASETVFVTVMHYLMRPPRWGSAQARFATDAHWHAGCSVGCPSRTEHSQ